MPGDFARPVRFALVGIANTLVDMAAFTLLIAGTALPPPVANVISYTVATINSYVLNRHWTFRDARASGWRRQLPRFTAVNIAALGLSTTVVWVLAPSLGALPAKLAAVAATFAFSYTLNRLLVFQPA